MNPKYLQRLAFGLEKFTEVAGQPVALQLQLSTGFQTAFQELN
jgi:hypothetical protein